MGETKTRVREEGLVTLKKKDELINVPYFFLR